MRGAAHWKMPRFLHCVASGHGGLRHCQIRTRRDAETRERQRKVPVFRGFSLKRIFHERQPSLDTRDAGESLNFLIG